MKAAIRYLLNRTSAAQIAAHLARCDAEFVPPLSGRVGIDDYARKIVGRAARFEAWSGDTLVGLVAAYCNDLEKRIAYITSVSVLREWAGKGIVTNLMNQCVEHARALGMRQIDLEVASENTPAIRLYERCGFVAGKTRAPFVSMKLSLKAGKA